MKKLGIILVIGMINFAYASTPWVAIGRVIKKKISSSGDASQPQKHHSRLFQNN